MTAEQSDLELRALDVDEIAARVGNSDEPYASGDVLEVCRSLLIPEPAWHAQAVIDAAVRVIREQEEYFAAHCEQDTKVLGVLQSMSRALALNKWPGRAHLLATVPLTGNPFRYKCLSSAPLYSAVGLSSLSQPTNFQRVLAECLGAGMALCTSELSVDAYLAAATKPSDKHRLPVGHSRLAGAGRALRWLSKEAPSSLLEALGEHHRPGELHDAIINPSEALSAAYEALNDSTDSTRGHQSPGLARIDELIRFLEQAVLDAVPYDRSGGGKAGGGSGGGRTVQGNYQFSDGHAILSGGRDLTDDHPELPINILTVGQPAEGDDNGHPAETVPPDQLALVEPDPDDTDKPLDAQILAAKHKAALIERANQALPFGWGTSTGAEISKAVELTSPGLVSDDAQATAMALSALLATGCTVTGLSDIRWASGKDAWRSGIEYDLSARNWRIGAQIPAFTNSGSRDSDAACVIPAESIALPDYYQFHRFFDGDLEEMKQRRPAFKTGLTELRATARRTLQPEQRRGLRLSLERIANMLGQTLQQQTQDVGPLANLLADASWHSQTVSHYQVTTAERLRADYRSAHVQIAPNLVKAWDRDHPPVQPQGTRSSAGAGLWDADQHLGAHRLPLLSDLQNRVASIKASLASNERQSTDVPLNGDGDVNASEDHRVAYHNDYAQYVASWIMFESALRAIIDPAPMLIDQVTDLCPPATEAKRRTPSKVALNLGFISDKDRGARYLDRLAAYSGELIEQCDVWDRHARHIRRLALGNGVPATDDVFFVIDARGRQKPLRPTHFQSSGFQLPYSANAFRRLVRSYLSHVGVNGELIDAYLGHGRRGTERWGVYSTLSMPAVIREVAPRLDELRDEIGWTVIGSPHAH